MRRGRCQGLLTVARLNWPYYLGAGAVLLASIAGACWLSAVGVRLACAAAFLGAAWFLLGSLGVTHWAYDCSDLYRMEWLKHALASARRDRLIFCHAGFDDASPLMKEKFREAEWRTLDHFQPARMTEASIRRARRLSPPTKETQPAAFDRWPVEEAWADAVIGFLAIHELRSEEERSRWFVEARRCVCARGPIVLVEHLRDFANFLAFGPGFVHFHSRESWRRAWEHSGLRLVEEFSVTPFVRVFVLGSP